MRISTIVPVYNSADWLRKSLAALLPSVGDDFEIIVVDDASTDDVAAVVEGLPVRFLRMPRNVGPAGARNQAATQATGEILFFVDADVVVKPDTVARIRATFEAEPELAAVFGSYDDQPGARDVLSQYRNLLHHYVHQEGSREAFTFWSGCGAMRKDVFDELGGYDERRYARGLQDVELGYRVRDAGHRIVLDKDILCTHLKNWPLWLTIETDIFKRAVPWTYLIHDRGVAPSDLNIKADQRMSTALVGVAGLSALLSIAWPALLAVTLASLAGVAFINRKLYGFFRRKRGIAFALATFPLHLLYFVCSGFGFVYGTLCYHLGGVRKARAEPDTGELPRTGR